MSKYTGFEIAVIGMSIRCPGANNISEYWENLVNGKESIKQLTREQLIAMGVEEDTINNPNYIKASGALEGSEFFDANFFNYVQDEATHLDPQTRVYHEITWEALEDAGCNPNTYSGMIGMFIGVPINTMWKVYSSLSKNNKNLNQYYIEILNNKDSLPMLISNKLNLQGPSFSVNTACSSSLVAIHQACRSILTGDCNVAVAGGVNIGSNQKAGYFYEEDLIFSSDGHCKPFDSNANGTIFSEGAGAVVLKRLSEAIKDKDHIYGIVKGSAINNDGNRKLGYMSPSIEGQTECARKAIIMSKVKPESISYVEAHGTGTKLGDPVELKALEEAYQIPDVSTCAIGSVKSNIGHLDTASGVAGLIKVLLSLEKKKIPALINFNKANENIDFANSPFYVNDKLRKWESKEGEPLRAAVSSFGIGGTNAHLILEEAPREENLSSDQLSLFTFSAKTNESLLEYLKKYANYLSKNDVKNLSSLAYSLALGRSEFDYRITFPSVSKNNLIKEIETAISKKPFLEPINSEKQIVFMFSGQGSQYSSMGKDMYDHLPFFKSWIDKGLNLLESLSNENFKQFIFSTSDNEELTDTKYVQPLLFIFEYAVAKYLMHLGINPKFMIGHSVGEYVAAALSGVFSYEEGLILLVERGKLIGALPKGSMLSVATNQEGIKEYLNKKLSVASINSPNQLVISGDVTSINELSSKLENKDITNIKLRTSHAFHSAMMDPIIEDFRAVLKRIQFNIPKIPFISNLTGKLALEEEVISEEYWLNHLRHTVKFSEGIKTLVDHKTDTFLELGPGKTLTTLFKQNTSDIRKYLSINLIPHRNDTTDSSYHFLENIGKLWSNGVKIDWKKYYSEMGQKKVPMPTYAFEKTKYPVVVGNYQSIKENGFENFKHDKKSILDSFYLPSWKKAYLVKNKNTLIKKYSLFFAEESDLSNKLEDTFSENKSNLLVIKKGDEFFKISDVCYQINPNDSSHYIRLFQDLENKNIVPETVLYNWKSPDEIIFDTKMTLDENTSGFFYMQNILKSLDTIQGLKNNRVFLISDSLYNIINTEKISTEHAITSGLLKVVTQEIPSVFSCIIDTNLGDTNDLVKLSQHIYDEVEYNNLDKIVALRNGIRWTQHIENIPVTKEKHSKIRENGIYLITGGLGRLGHTIAKYLYEKYNAKLILLGRTKLPPYTEWTDKKLNENIKLQRLNELLNIGAQVEYLGCNINDENEFTTILNDTEMRIGKVDGVIHAAGILDSDYFMHGNKIDMKKAVSQFGPKMYGTRNLHSYFEKRKVDFVWLSSSLSSFLGGVGNVSYSSGNIFMDSFVIKNARNSVNWISVNLDTLKLGKKEDKEFIGENELIEAFEASLKLQGINQVIVAKGNIQERFKKYILDRMEEVDSVSKTTIVSSINRSSISNQYVEPSTNTEKKLVEIWTGFLNINNIGIEDDFFELGGDSLKGMALLKLIMKEFGVKINLVELFETASVKTLASKIDMELSEVVKVQEGEKNIII